MNGAEVLVTGGGGFLGGWLANELVDRGARVTVTSRDGNSRVPLHPSIEIAKIDVTVKDQLAAAMLNKQLVFHAAALDGSSSYKSSHPAQMMFTNAALSLAVFSAVADSRSVELLVYISSADVYSSQLPAPFREEDGDLFEPLGNTGDGWAKRFCERGARLLQSERPDLQVCVIRPTNLFGPFDRTDAESARLVATWLQRCMNKEVLETFGSSESTRSLLYVGDAAKAVADLSNHRSPLDKQEMITVNLPGIEISLDRLAREIMIVTGTEVPIVENNYGSAATRRSLSDERIKNYLPRWKPTSLRLGLNRTHDWLQSQYLDIRTS